MVYVLFYSPNIRFSTVIFVVQLSKKSDKKSSKAASNNNVQHKADNNTEEGDSDDMVNGGDKSGASMTQDEIDEETLR